MSKILFSCLMTLVFCCGSADAGLIGVEFDDFTISFENGEVFSPPSVCRTATANPAQFMGNKFSLDLSNNSLSLAYQVGGSSEGIVSLGNFGDVYATSGAPSEEFDGFSIDVSFAFGGAGFVSISNVNGGDGGLQYYLNNGTNVFRDVAMPSDSFVKFTFNYTVGDGEGSGSMTINSISAVPEASSLLLAGTALVGLCSFRRRKSA